MEMTQGFDRKKALRDYKERKVRAGVYAVRDLGTGRAWAGAAQDLDATRNGLWNTLNAGRHLDKGLQAEWSRLGEARFEYVVLEVFEQEMTPLVLKETLKARKAEWAQVLATTPLGPGE
jgi:hypothetical protein